MPFDLYLNSVNDKSSVIFDFGTAYTKLGFSGETGPRTIVSTTVKRDGKKVYIFELSEAQEQREALISFLYEIYYRKLLVSSKDRRVVVVESVLNSTQRRELIADVLFKHYEVPSILFAPVHLVSLFGLGLQTGLVVDCGHIESSTVPVYEGFHLMRDWQAVAVGGHAVEKNIFSLLMESGTMLDPSNKDTAIKDLDDPTDVLTREVLEDIKVRMCLVTSKKRAAQWRSGEKPPLVEDFVSYFTHNSRHGDICIKVPIEVRELAWEPLIVGDGGSEDSLVGLVRAAVAGAPVDCRRSLCEHMVLVGGSAHTPGLAGRLLAELGPQYKLHNPATAPARPNYLGWLGAAMLGALDVLPVRSLTREAYLEAGGRLRDWLDCGAEESGPRTGA